MGGDTASSRHLPPEKRETTLRQPNCYLCGLPVGFSMVGEDTRDGLLSFCCTGCRQVFLILSAASGSLPADFSNTDIYRTCRELGIIPGGASPPLPSTSTEMSTDQSALDFTFPVQNMWCPSCAWLIEEILRRMSGVIEPRVSFLADSVRLKYLPYLISPAEITSAVARLGYPTSSHDDGGTRKTLDQKDLVVRLGLSAILSMNAMMLSAALYFGFFRDLSPAVIRYFSYPLLLMAAPVVFYGGAPILRNAWTAARLKTASMDTLIAIGTLSAFSYSLLQMAKGSIHLYLDTAAMLVTIVLVGRYVEMRARQRVFASLGLNELSPDKVRLLHGSEERWVSAEAVMPGDIFLVKAEERVPLDGRILKGRGLLDQSILTGEPRPARKSIDQEVAAGSLLLDGEMLVAATAPVHESSLQRMVHLMTEALDRRYSQEEFTDSLSRFFVPAILSITAITGLVLWSFAYPAQEILLRCLTVLIISCPCAIGIAVPLVRIAVIGLGRRKGLLIRNPEALERIPHLDTMILDKTGTVTEGRFRLREVVVPEALERDVIRRIAPLEAGSSHFLAREILRRARELDQPLARGSDIREDAGLGITGRVLGETVFVGNRRLLAQQNVGLSTALDKGASLWEQRGMTVVFFGWNGKIMGFLVFGDSLRPDAERMVSSLKEQGINVVLLSGDGQKTTAAVAASLGIGTFFGQIDPVEKAETVTRFQKEGHIVGMAGDGVNDAGALARADVAFAIGSGYDIIKAASDLLVPSGQPSLILNAFDLSALSRRAVRQNLYFAFLYNTVAIAFAATGLLNPLIAVIAMFASSLTVIGNALRITRRKGRSDAAGPIYMEATT